MSIRVTQKLLTRRFIPDIHDVGSLPTFLGWTLLLVLHSHVVNEFDVTGQKLFDVVTGMMSINSMSITDTKEPVILDLSEVLDNEERILIGF